MKFEDFQKVIEESGWRDATYSDVEALWRRLFPLIAELED